MSVPEEPRDKAQELARIVGDPGTPRPERDGAWERLSCLIEEEIAPALSAGLRGAVPEALAKVWARLDPQSGWEGRRFDPARGGFRAWCRQVLYRFAVDCCRQRRRGPVLAPTGCSRGQDGPPAQEPADRSAEREECMEGLMERKLDLRAACDRLAEELGRQGRGVDYFSVLLVQLRLAMGRRVHASLTAADLGEDTPVSAFIAWCLPWHPAEQARRFRPGWPTLADVWKGIGPCLDLPPHSLTPLELCDRVTRLRGGVADLTPDVWNHWVKRAKEKGREYLGEDQWSVLLAPYLPDRRAGEGEPS